MGEGAPERREEGVFALPTATSDGASSGPGREEGSGAEVRPDLPPPDRGEAGAPLPAPDANTNPTPPGPPDAAPTPLVDADFVRALSSPWRLECAAARVFENWRGGPPGVGRDCGPEERAWVFVTSSKPALSADVVAWVRGALFGFYGPVPSTATIAQVDASRPLGADGCAATGTNGVTYSTSTKSGYCKGTPATCMGRYGPPLASSFGGARAIRRTTLADGRKLYWLADPLETAVPSSELEVPSYNYGACIPSTGAAAENRLCRFFHVEVP